VLVMLAAASALLSGTYARTAIADKASTVSSAGHIVVTQATARHIDRLVRAALLAQHLAAVSLAIGDDGTIIYAKGYGYRDLARHLPATPQTIYNIASMSKQYTAACVLLLQEDGKLNIDDRLSRYLPNFPNGNTITVREVLNHTSGLSDYLDLIDNATLTPAKVRAALYKLKLKFRPGSRFDYSNSNYIVAGLVVEKASGMPFDDFLRSRILHPLHLQSTTVGTSPLDLAGGATGYTVVKGRTVPVDQRADAVTTLDFPDGGINSTVSDLVRWDNALDSGRVINQQLLAMMFTPSLHKADWPGGYALGVGLDSVGKHREIVHTGGWIGFTGINATLPDDRFAVVMLSNTDTFDKTALAQRIIRLFYR
ncbi:MAG TPA: serine hydrolase domain-containing protein, partial [Candidatus Eremiobacteraceae bacterium]|nr:serine hydrolase domain-containing protein [Candidatus Eremiobacteraceae bacterium]